MEQNLKLLPKRPRPVQQKAFVSKVKLITNFNHIQLRKQPDIYQFTLDTEPVIPDDSIEVLRHLVKSLRQPLFKEIRIMCHKGKMIWGLRHLEKPLVLMATHKKQSYEVLIKEIKVIRENEIGSLTGNALREVLSVYSVAMKQKLISMGMVEVARGRYIRINTLKDEQYILKDAGLHLIRTYTFKLASLSQGIKLQVDIGTRAFRIQNFLETLSNSKTMDQKMNFIDSIVQCKYGNRRSYKITNLNFTLTPLSKFYQQKNQQYVTYLEYYTKRYNIKIKQMKQPLIEAIQRTERNMIDGKLVKKQIKVYLIPELVRLVGIPKFDKKDQFRIMQQFAEFSKMQPIQRDEYSKNIIYEFNRQKGDLQIGNSVEVDGFILPSTTYITSYERRTENGLINIRQKVKDPMKLQKFGWICVYYQTSQYDDDEADELISCFQKAQNMFGITIMDPQFVIIEKDHPQDWKKAIRSAFDPKKHKLILLLFSNRQSKYYGQLKTFLINEMKVSSQVILKRTIKSKGLMSISSKIICQMNAKLGKALWEVVPKHKFCQGKSIAYGGISISGSQKLGHSLSFVGTFSKDLTKYYCSNRNKLPSRQQIDQNIYEELFIEWIKKYAQFMKSVPDVIIVYRQGLSEQQIKVQGQKQLSALFKVIARTNKRYLGYSPQIVYIVTNKRISTKFYSCEIINRSPGKFIPKLMNPQPGTVIFEPLSSEKSYDFHLAAQRVTQGTCTPTHYRIAYDDSQIPQQALAQFTYEQCYNYYNWTGAIRVPSCLQMADKLSKFMGQQMKQSLVSSELTKTPFYL